MMTSLLANSWNKDSKNKKVKRYNEKRFLIIHYRHYLLVAFALSMVSCADDDLGNNLSDGDKEAIVQFEITDAQEEALSKYNASTRGAITAGLSDKDLEGKKIRSSKQQES